MRCCVQGQGRGTLSKEQGDKGTRRQGDKGTILSPHPPIPPSPPLPPSPSLPRKRKFQVLQLITIEVRLR
ncbi:hypothetical protein [Tolypothrix sp. VBCCA 56010]|uniref:hypothetical protein n=1 Tax=Tolypothrix sp. VBCCA 56010 TaxID=3137731 RepID=UPI003D7E6C30